MLVEGSKYLRYIVLFLVLSLGEEMDHRPIPSFPTWTLHSLWVVFVALSCILFYPENIQFIDAQDLTVYCDDPICDDVVDWDANVAGYLNGLILADIET